MAQNKKEPNANEIAMLLANMAKDDALQRILDLKRNVPKELSTSKWAIDQLLDCFVKGAEGAYNKHADYDYLSYFFADLAKVPCPKPTGAATSTINRHYSSPKAANTLLLPNHMMRTSFP